MNIADLGNTGMKFGFRPERAVLSVTPMEGKINWKMRIVTREMLGDETIYSVRNEKGLSFMVKELEDDFSEDQAVYLSVEDKFLYFFDKDGMRVRPGQEAYEQCVRYLKGAEKDES